MTDFAAHVRNTVKGYGNGALEKLDEDFSEEKKNKLEKLSLKEFNDGVREDRIEMVDITSEEEPEYGPQEGITTIEDVDCYTMGIMRMVGTKDNHIKTGFLNIFGGIMKAPVLYGKYINRGGKN